MQRRQGARWTAAWALAVTALGLLTACSGSPGRPASRATTGAAAAPASAAPAASAAGQSVPMTVVKSGSTALEIVPVYVDGHGPYRFLLDTGSSISSVTSRLATALHLPRTGSTALIKGVVKSQQVPIVAIRAWKLGHVLLTPEKVAVLNSSGSGSVAGLLGSDELSRFSSVTEDFQHGKLLLTPP